MKMEIEYCLWEIKKGEVKWVEFGFVLCSKNNWLELIRLEPNLDYHNLNNWTVGLSDWLDGNWIELGRINEMIKIVN